MAVIDSNSFITHLVWSGLIDKATCGELKEAIELCTVKDIYTKADMVAMLTEIQLEIEEWKEVNQEERMRCEKEGSPILEPIGFENAMNTVNRLIQDKINVLKEQNNG